VSAVKWLDVDYGDPDRPPAQTAPVGWQDEPEWLTTADEAMSIETATGGLAAARRGLTTVYWGTELIRADLDTEADAHADYARIRAEITGNPEHRLQAAGAHLAAVRLEQRQVMAYLADVLPGAIAAGVSEVRAARLAGVDRLTVRSLLGKGR
jgi:hypothetical protein